LNRYLRDRNKQAQGFVFAKDSFDNCEAIRVQLCNDLWRGDHPLIVTSGIIVPRGKPRVYWEFSEYP